MALTANVMDADREKCLNAGMQVFLTESVNRKALFETLNELILQRLAA